MKRVLFAYYSPSAAKNNGTVWWQTLDGKEVECTEFCKTKDGHVIHDDSVFVGRVKRFLRDGRNPSVDFSNYYYQQ